MDKIQKEEMRKETGTNSILKEKLIIAFSSVFEALFLLLELYFMIHSRENFIALIVVAICMILVLFFLVMAIIDLNQKIKNMEWKEYQDIYKAQKASYLSTKRAFDELGQRLSALEESNTFPAEDIISAQKAVAKVTISRNKENAEALMNANDELIQRVFGFEEKLADNKEELMKLQQEIMQQTKDEMNENQRNIQSQFDAIQNLLQQVQQDISTGEIRTMDTAIEDSPVDSLQEDWMEPEDEELPDLGGFEEESEEQLPSLDEAEIPAEDELPSLDDVEMPAEDELPSLDEVEVSAEPISDPNKTLSPDEIAALFSNMEDTTVQPEEEPEELPMPDMSDPNKSLSPDEIAALFANAGNAESVTEEEPEPEKPPMPDLSDPNKTLSPDEIAALFANM